MGYCVTIKQIKRWLEYAEKYPDADYEDLELLRSMIKSADATMQEQFYFYGRPSE
jgi:hypothetical protein